ncbi:PREDICTED: uncharacterized protein LOC109327062 [Lupinus angustifolius]|uniref:uncharacterized protein LOC109327062 n=1 Tax=Lupinus angustifolius TaxID=3871 RepID=UPI00092F46CC|nr:PREDICTED: uncharacterized protein LOC109327062 [Lupinus angustifolius]
MENRSIHAINLIQDPSSPFYMPPNENPGAIMVSSLLNGENYHSWSRAMSMALKSKHKLQFIDDTLLNPSIDEPSFSMWDRCNTLVISWLTQSIESSIAQSVLWMETTLEIWQDLRERYYQGDIFRIFELFIEIHTYKQGNLSIASYFTHFKGLWQELDNFKLIHACYCVHKCDVA